MARLARLKLSMTVSVLLVTIIFAAFLIALAYLVQLPPIPALSIAILGTLLFILLQYLIGPEIVRWSTKLHYLKPGENPWLETTVKDLAEKSNIPPPKLAIVPDKTPNAFVFGRTTQRRNAGSS